MRKIALFCCLLLAAPMLLRPLSAQETTAAATQAHYYHLEFVVKELGDDGKVVNGRTYRTTVSTDDKMSSVRTGTRIPVHTNDKGGDIQYLDVGVNIDCRQAHEIPAGLALQITAEISSLATPNPAGDISTPIIRQNHWQSATVLPLGKPTIVFSSDNLENKGRMQVEVTATPIR